MLMMIIVKNVEDYHNLDDDSVLGSFKRKTRRRLKEEDFQQSEFELQIPRAT